MSKCAAERCEGGAGGAPTRSALPMPADAAAGKRAPACATHQPDRWAPAALAPSSAEAAAGVARGRRGRTFCCS